MQYVPVVSANGKPLMPCHPARARQLVRKGYAIRRFDKGIFYIRLTRRRDGETQIISLGIDPGSKKEALTVKSSAHTYLNIQADAVTWVKDVMTTRRLMRHARRTRKCPYRQPRWSNRAKKGIPPSTKARWQWKLRLCNWLSGLYPVSKFVVEEICAVSKKNQRKWNASFLPLEVGRKWFYAELEKLAPVETLREYETKRLRDSLDLKKSSDKMSDKFEAHCIDSWVLANWWTGGHMQPDNTEMLFVTPLRFHRRQLHRLQPEIGGGRKPYGGTRSLGFRRGSLVKHPKWGFVYVGGCTEDRISLYSLRDGTRLCQNAKPSDVKFLAFSSWRTHSSAA